VKKRRAQREKNKKQKAARARARMREAAAFFLIDGNYICARAKARVSFLELSAFFGSFRGKRVHL
jgi:hypothetical protein